MITDPQEHTQQSRSAGLFLAVSAALFIIGILWHTFVHPSAGATSEHSMRLIQRAPNMWLAMHVFLAAVSALFAAAALAVLTARSSLTASFPGVAGWSLLAVLAGLMINPIVVEATVQSDAAVAGDVTIFTMWSALSRGYDLVLGLVPLAFLGITLADLRSAQPATPRWASGLALAGAALMLVGVIGATGFGMAALGVLWGGAARLEALRQRFERRRRGDRRRSRARADRARALLPGEHGAARAIGGGRAGEVRQMGLLPLARLVALGRGRRIHLVVQPAVPAGRNRGCLGIALIDDPAPRAAFRIRAALVIDIAELVFADALAVAPGVKARSDRLSIPPGENLQQELHRHRPLPADGRQPDINISPPLMPRHSRLV